MSLFDKVKSEIRYCSYSGQFYWLKYRAGRNDQPGHVGSGGYLKICINRKIYLAHRLAWFLYYGRFPSKQIDHIDGDRLNNKISNLREASSTQNNRNASLRSDNKSGVRGVCWKNREQKWHAQISVDKKNISIGYFISLDEAKQAYAIASEKYHGEFGKVI